MIFVIHNAGQTCNRILYFIRALATALDRNENICHLYGQEILKFTDTHPDAIPQISVKLCNRNGSKIVRVAFYCKEKFLPKIFAISGPRWLPHFLGDWRYGNHGGVARHRETICAYLRPKDKFRVRPGALISRLRNRGSVRVVGVHVRRGDYKDFMDGKYYFSDAQYSDFMCQYQLASNLPCHFVIVSNDTVDCAVFHSRGLDITLATSIPQEDIVTLSMCDITIGPPSTFSGVAAYIGGVQRIELCGTSEFFLRDCVWNDIKTSSRIADLF